jgi:hypothetical protein
VYPCGQLPVTAGLVAGKTYQVENKTVEQLVNTPSRVASRTDQEQV